MDKTQDKTRPNMMTTSDNSSQVNLLGLPQLSQIDEPMVFGKESVRQSKSFRQPPMTNQEHDKLMYYHLNNRLVEEKPRKLTPHRDYYRTIDPSDHMNTSRFGDKDKEIYKKNRQQNLFLIENNERDFEFLSGHSESSFPSRVPSPDDKSNISDHSRITKFLIPREHIDNLHRQKSPLRRSNSAQFLRTMIQGRVASPDFYKVSKP